MSVLRLAGGSDVAHLVIFDCEAVSQEDASRLLDDAIAEGDRLMKEGKIISIPTDGDGGYLLHLYVDEQVPKRLAEHCKDPIEVPSFKAPTGKMAFGGIESVPDKYTNNAAIRSDGRIQPGEYRVTIWRTEYPGDEPELSVKRALSSRENLLRGLPGYIIGLSVLTTGILLIWFYIHDVRLWWIAAMPALCIGSLVMLSKSSAYQSANRKASEIELEYPSVVALFQPNMK